MKGAVMPAHESHYLGKAIRILALCVPIIGAFAVMVLPIAFALAWYRETDVIAAANLVPRSFADSLPAFSPWSST